METTTYKPEDVLKEQSSTLSPIVKTTDLTSTPYTFREQPAGTAANDVISTVESMSLIAQQTQDRADAREIELNKSRSKVTGIMDKLGLRGQRQLQLEDDADIDEKTMAVNDIRNKIDARTLAYRRQIESIRKNSEGKFGGAVEQNVRKVEREAASELADLSIIQSARNNDLATAQSIVDRKIKLEFEPLEQQLEFQKYFYEDNKDLFNTADQRAFETKIRADERQYTEKREDFKMLQETKLKALMEAQANGAPNSVLMAIQSATSPEQALFNAGQYVGLLDRQLKNAQLSKIYSDIQADLEANKPVDVQALIDGGASTSDANTAGLVGILGSTKIGQGTKTQVANILSVINASGELAKSRQDGKFEGLNPLQAVGDFIFPNALRSKASVENRGQLDAINLKVQQWASGASLTAQQIEQVNRFTPSRNDTDAAVRTKLNNLTNFMLTQAQSQLQSEGVNYIPAKVNLFETYDMMKQLSPEQRKELEAQGLI